MKFAQVLAYIVCLASVAVAAFLMGRHTNFLRGAPVDLPMATATAAHHEAVMPQAVIALSGPSVEQNVAGDATDEETGSPDPKATNAEIMKPTKAQDVVRPSATLQSKSISIQTAVTKICEQMGLKYDWTRSQNNCGRDCRKLIEVDISGVTLEQAMEQLVLRNGLRYKLQQEVLWLEKVQ